MRSPALLAGAVVVVTVGMVLMLPMAGFGDAPLSAFLASPTAAGEGGHTPALACVERPLCDSPRLTLLGSVLCLRHTPLQPGSHAYHQYAKSRVRELLPRFVKGQLAINGVVAVVERKLMYPHEPAVMHFAGDNGVGKTRTTEAVSLALGQRCAGNDCSLGDSTLVLSGTAYDGMSLAEFRRAVVPLITSHARRFPGNGVLVINDLTALDPAMVRMLLPVLGRARVFPEYPSVDLSALIVMVTTDFGREGRTQGRGVDEIRAFINAEFREVYSHLATANIQTFPFLSISLQTAREVAAATTLALGCDACAQPVSISEDAVSLVVERVKPVLAAENGRAVRQQVVGEVGPLVDTACLGRDEKRSAGGRVSVDLDSEGNFRIVSSSDPDHA